MSKPAFDNGVMWLSVGHDLECSIGVVLHMIYVLILVTYRMFHRPAHPSDDEAGEEETKVLRSNGHSPTTFLGTRAVIHLQLRFQPAARIPNPPRSHRLQPRTPETWKALH